MTDLTTMIAALKAGDVDSVLVGTKYKGASAGVWEWDEGHDYKDASRCITLTKYGPSDEQVICCALSSDIGPSRKWQCNAPLLKDAKTNAAKVIVQAELIRVLVEALTNLVALYDDDEGCRQLLEYKAGKAALAAANEMKDA